MVKCDYPVIEHGRLISGIKEKYYYQAMVLLECLPGFYLNGSNRVFCGENSTWDPKIPKCIKGTNVFFHLFVLVFISLTLYISDTESLRKGNFSI